MNNEFSEVCRTCFRPIYNYVYARVLRRETAEDITQDSFAYALAHWENYDAARGNHLAYLYRIAASRLADHFRKAYLQREVPAEDVLEIADGAAAAFPPVFPLAFSVICNNSELTKLFANPILDGRPGETAAAATIAAVELTGRCNHRSSTVTYTFP